MLIRIPAFVSLFFGSLGLVVCVAIIVGTWGFASRLNRVTADVFEGFERVFVAAKQQVARADDRVDALKLNAEELNASLETWGEKEVAGRLSSRLRVEENIDRLESGLNQADQWLEVIESSVLVVDQAAESGRAIGITFKTDALDSLQREVAAVRASLSEVTGSVAKISERVSQLGDEKTDPDRAGKIVNLTTRLVATFGSIDSRLQALDAKLTEADTVMRETRETVIKWIWLAAAAITLLACWMAAGQGSLIYLGIRGLKRPRMGKSQ
jgi:hypothetical protein